MKIDKPKLIWQLTFEGAWVTSVAFVGKHNRIAAGNRRGQILIWDLPETPDSKSIDFAAANKKPSPSSTPSRLLKGHKNSITHLLSTRDGKTLISTSLDRTIRLWKSSSSTTGEDEIILDSAYRKVKTRYKKGKEKEDILKAPGVQIKTQSDPHTLSLHKDWINSLGLSRDESRLITGDDACHTIVWDFKSRKPHAQWDGYNRNWVTTASLSPDGKSAFVGEFCSKRGDFDKPAAQARLYDASIGKENIDLLKVQFPKVKTRDDSYGYASVWGKFVKRGFVTSAFSPDGKTLAIGQGGETDTGKIHLINTIDGKLIRTVSGHKYGVTDVLFSDDGKYIISAGRDTTVRICQVADGKEIAALGKPRGGQFKDWIHAISISHNQQWIAAADMAGMVHVWQLST